MLKICAPREYQQYLDYTFSVVFDEWLGCAYEVSYDSKQLIELFFDGREGEKIVASTVFFANVLESDSEDKDLTKVKCSKLSLVDIKRIVPQVDARLFSEDLPVLFGAPVIELEASNISMGFDIFGTIFFMLSRYEEIVNPERDHHDRSPASASLAYKHGFLERPIVDEYVELLWACMQKLWPELQRKERQPQLFVSCDVDTPFDPTVRNAYQLGRTCLADLVKRKSPIEAARRIRRYAYNKSGDFRFDQNYTFDWYMGVCEEAGLTAAFYFIPTSVEAHNGYYELTDPAIRELLVKIDRRGHEIGVHGSYQTYKDGEKVIQQKELLDKALFKLGIKQQVKGNRQHYLRWDSSVTPGLLEKAGFEYDTTGGYADHAGFRFATCKEFSMWCWQTRKKLNIKQRPLIVMECTVIDDCYMGLGVTGATLEFINRMRISCSQVNGDFSLLWHNSSLSSIDIKNGFFSVLNAMLRGV